MIEQVTVSLPSVLTIVVISVSWAASIAGVYFGLRNRMSSTEQRLDRVRSDLDNGSRRFAALEARHGDFERGQVGHGERIIVLETLLGTMNTKLDSILTEVKNK
jgi:hypothetical protein